MCLKDIVFDMQLRGHGSEGSRSKDTWVMVKCHIGQGQIRILKKGRWDQNNVKLFHLGMTSKVMVNYLSLIN